MKTLLCLTVSTAFLLIAQARASDFSKALSPEDFASAGLAKLTPEELAHLDALVHAQREGKAKTETRESPVTIAKSEKSEVSALPSQQVPERPRVSQEAPNPQRKEESVVLAPGTKVSYRDVETQLVGSFRGYETGSILTLANGQRWVVTNGSYWAGKDDAEKPRKVVIKSGTLGSFFLDIENGGRPKVKLVAGNLRR